MSEDQEKLAAWLTYLNEKNLWENPRRAYAHICDKFYDDSDTIVLYKEFLLSDIGNKLISQINSNGLDAKALYLSYKDGAKDKTKLADYINAVCQVYGVTSGLDDLQEENPVFEALSFEENSPLPDFDFEPEKSADEYYQDACRLKGNLGVTDTDTYVRYMSKAADKGHIKAIQIMARSYMRGKYVAQDEAKAVELFQKGADLNDGQCCYELYRYYQSRNIERDLMMKYMKKAADLNVPSAKYDLAVEYSNEGTEDGRRKAFATFKEAGEQGDPCAFYQLALCYRFGRGVDQDMGQAKKMLEKAAELGHSEARDILKGGVI